jgi:hypothetical protein
MKQAFREVLQESVMPELKAIKKRMTTLEKEVWNVLKGVGRVEGGEPDVEWTERLEALHSWARWGESGSGYGHLPVIIAEELEQRDTESEGVRGVEESSEDGEVGESERERKEGENEQDEEAEPGEDIQEGETEQSENYRKLTEVNGG